MKKPVNNTKEKNDKKPVAKKDVSTSQNKLNALSSEVLKTSKVIEKVKRIDVVYEKETQVYENEKLISSKKEEVIESFKNDAAASSDLKSALIQKVEQKIAFSPNKINLSKIVDGALLAVVIAQVVGLLYILLK